MAIKLTDKIAGVTPRGTVATAFAKAKAAGAKRLEFLLDYLTELFRLCVMFAWDFAIIVGQSANETGFWGGRGKNPNWETLGNPAGLAITNAENKSINYANGTDAARAHAVHWWIYLYGPLEPTDYLYQFRNLDAHYSEAATGTNIYSTKKPYSASVVTIADLNDPGQWALIIDERTGEYLHVYGERVLEDAKELWGTLPNQTGATTPPPVDPEEPPMATKKPIDLIKHLLIDAPVTKRAEGQGFNYGTRNIIGIVQHETQGTGSGPWYRGFFSCKTSTSCDDYGICSDGERCGNALVDFLIDTAGKIYQFQDPFTSNRIPWASGGGNAGPNRNNADGKAVDNKYGNRPGGVNSVYAAVELVKTDAGHLTAAQIESTALLTAYIAAMCGYPANDWKYPDSLGGNIPTSTDHSRISLGTNCVQYVDDRAKFEARVTTILTGYYGDSTGTGTTGGDPPTSGPTDPVTPAIPEIVPGVDWGIAARAFGTLIPGYVLTEGGPLSTLYVARATAEDEWPPLTEKWPYDDGRNYFRFSNGWLALDPPGDNKPVFWVR